MPSFVPGLLVQVCTALALLVFVNDLWRLAPVEHALVSAAGVGLALYATLGGGYWITRRILDRAPEPAPASPDETPSENAAAPADAPAPTDAPPA